MKERQFGRDTEHPAVQSRRTARGATVTKSQRSTITDKPNVDELVTDFLHSLDTYDSAVEAPARVDSEKPAPNPPEAEPQARNLLNKPAPAIRPIAVPTKAKNLQADVDAELERILLEIESIPKLSLIRTPAHETAIDLPASPSKIEPIPVPEEPAHMPVLAAETRVAEAEAPIETTPSVEVPMVAEAEGETEQSTLRLPLTILAPDRTIMRRLGVVFAAVFLTAAICLSVYLTFLRRSAPIGNGAGANLHSVAQIPDAKETHLVAAAGQAAQDGLPLQADAPAGGAQIAQARSTPAADLPPAAKTAAPAAGDRNSRTKAAPPPNATTQSRGVQDNIAEPAKQTPPARDETQGNNNAAVTPTQPTPPPSAPAGAKPGEAPTTSGQVQSPAAPTKANAEPPPNEAPKVPPPTLPPPGGSAATANPAEAVNPKTSVPAANTKSVPIATAPEAVLKVAPTYPVMAQRMRLSGTVDVRVAIDEKGKVTKATAINGEYVLRPAAEDALMKWKFKPATLRGVSVKSELVVSVSFIR